MSVKLSSEKEHLVLDNQRLVHYLVQKLGVTPNSSEYEDIVSIGTIGLVKAAITFDSSKKITFATYASRCINNEIFMHYRKANKYANDISIDEPIGNDGEGKELTLGDTIEHSESDFVEKIVNKEAFIQLVSIILNYLEEKTRLVILYRMGEVSQADIAEKLNISRSYVSRIVTKATNKIREVANHQVHYKEVFSMAIVGDEYRISFSSKDISKFNKIFAALLQNLTSTEKLPDFRVNCNKERIVVQIPAHPESFSFIAQIIQEIDDFSMAFVSDKSTLPTGNTVMQKVETDEADERDDTVEGSEFSAIVQNSDVISDVVNETEAVETAEETETIEVIEEDATSIMEQETQDSDTVDTAEETLVEEPIVEDTASTSEELDTVAKTDAESTVERGSQVKQVRDYMLSISSFTVKDLKHHFPNLTTGTINNAVYLAKSKGLITATGRGEYSVKAVEPHVVEKSSTSASTSTEMTQIDKDNTTESNIGKTKRHTSQSKKVREFILTLDRFSVKQVISNFPDVPAAIVNNVIRLAKTKGLITCVARGEYVVNKT